MTGKLRENIQAKEVWSAENRPEVMGEGGSRGDRRRRRQRRLRWIIFVCLFFLALSIFLETRIFKLGELELPISGNLLIFVMININLLLLVTVIFLVLRNLVELVFERRQPSAGGQTTNQVSYLPYFLVADPHRVALFGFPAVHLRQHGLLVQHQRRALSGRIPGSGS